MIGNEESVEGVIECIFDHEVRSRGHIQASKGQITVGVVQLQMTGQQAVVNSEACVMVLSGS